MSAFALSLSLAKRLYAVTAVIGAALAGLTVFAFAEMGAVIGASERVRDQRSPQLQRVAHMGLAITRSSLQLRHAMLARNPDERDAALQDVGRFRQAFDEALHAYQADAQTSAGQARAAAIATRAATFWQVGGRNIALIQRGDQATAFAFLVDNAIPARNALLKALHEAEDLHRQELERDVRRIGEEARATRNSVATLAGLILALLVAASLHVAKVLRQRVALTKRCADQVREGDFTQTLHDPARDEFSPLLQAMQDMKDSLSRVVGTVRANAESVAMASTQMAQGNLDLSQRTEEQASSLQQTAASMDALGAIVKRNAVHAQEAKRCAEGASTVAAQGGAVVGQVVTTMAGISDASRRITEIIGTIDGIAFQTNILALNAAVEAARAGEQGRGFAVVAGEVRLLARRSAEAAKEIKLLITQSGERVHHGAVLVEQAGQTMADVVASIQRVASLVAEISEGSNEQSAGIDQVGQAIAQMDTVTQQNAALVEESAAASESLRTQASELLGAVDRFKLAGVAGRV